MFEAQGLRPAPKSGCRRPSCADDLPFFTKVLQDAAGYDLSGGQPGSGGAVGAWLRLRIQKGALRGIRERCGS